MRSSFHPFGDKQPEGYLEYLYRSDVTYILLISHDLGLHVSNK